MNIHDILACTLLPYEWNIASMTWPQSFNSNYVEATYTWVCNNYDGTKPLHKLTLVYAMIFSKCLPNICNNTKPLNVSSTQDSISLVHQCPWVTHKDPNCKGNKNPISFVVMMTTFIISIYEDQSPL